MNNITNWKPEIMFLVCEYISGGCQIISAASLCTYFSRRYSNLPSCIVARIFCQNFFSHIHFICISKFVSMIKLSGDKNRTAETGGARME